MHQAAPGPKARHTIARIGGGEVTGTPAQPGPAHDEPGADYDALTDLFLGEGCLAPAEGATRLAPPPAVEGGELRARPGLVIEALVLGHLPVLASAWVGQYAKHVAQSCGRPVALLRVRAGSVALDLLGGAAGAGASTREPLLTLDDGLREGAAVTDRWILSVEATNEPRAAAMLGSGGIDRLTLLTGADEAAVVACYRTIKLLLARPQGEDPDEPGAAGIQLGVMGASADRAEEAGQKLAHAAETFLGQRPKVIACVSKIGGSASRPLYRGSDERTVEEFVAMIRGLAALPRPAPLSLVNDGPETVRAAHASPMPRVSATAGPTPHRTMAAAHAPTVGRVGMPGPSLPVALSNEAGGLAALLSGFTPIAFRCPYVNRVELAKTADGRLHLLARVENANGLGSAAAHLAGASAWAKAHVDLLMAACPGVVPELGDGLPDPACLYRARPGRSEPLGLGNSGAPAGRAPGDRDGGGRLR